jgi:hypothetical protein
MVSDYACDTDSKVKPHHCAKHFMKIILALKQNTVYEKVFHSIVSSNPSPHLLIRSMKADLLRVISGSPSPFRSAYP